MATSIEGAQEAATEALNNADLQPTGNSGVSTFTDDALGVVFTSSTADVVLDDTTETVIITGTDNLNATGNNLDNIVVTNEGQNTISTGAGEDQIDAGGGNDTVFGGTGNDTIDGGAGDDSVSGGEGADTFLFGSGAEQGNDVITDFQSDDVVVVGDHSGDSAVSQSDLQSVDQTLGGIVMNFADGTSLELNGVSSTDQVNVILDENGQATLSTGDTVDGGTGNDFIVGNTSDNTITGGEGADTFRIQNPGQGSDTITDFSAEDQFQINDRNGDGNLDGGDLQSNNGVVSDGTNTTINFADDTSVTFNGVGSIEDFNIEIDENGEFAVFTLDN